MSDLHLQVGQTMIMGFEGTTISPNVESLLDTIQPAGVILFGRNIESADQTHRLLGDCQDLVETPLFTCVDMEGGTVDRLRDVVAPAPSAQEVFATGSLHLAREHGRLIGKECRALGFNTDFAPVLDLGFDISSGVMGTRTVSPDAHDTTEYARAFISGLKKERVLSCGKHFPGLGEADLDSHQKMPVIQKDWKTLWKQDLEPYRALRGELDFVMVAHAAYPNITGDEVPASLSEKWMQDMLREVLGYQGLIVSDDLEMGSVLASMPIEQAAVQTIRAGADVFLVCRDEAKVRSCYEAVVREAERDAAFAKRVEAAADRVRKTKKQSRELRHPAMVPTQFDVEQLRTEMADFVHDIGRARAKRPSLAVAHG
ncbi:MAG: beta-N-acetylhexosaminidase [Terriglobales bacterium]